MKAEFWHERWHRNEIGFHEHATNRLLLAHCDVLSLTPRRLEGQMASDRNSLGAESTRRCHKSDMI